MACFTGVTQKGKRLGIFIDCAQGKSGSTRKAVDLGCCGYVATVFEILAINLTASASAAQILATSAFGAFTEMPTTSDLFGAVPGFLGFGFGYMTGGLSSRN